MVSPVSVLRRRGWGLEASDVAQADVAKALLGRVPSEPFALEQLQPVLDLREPELQCLPLAAGDEPELTSDPLAGLLR